MWTYLASTRYLSICITPPSAVPDFALLVLMNWHSVSWIDASHHDFLRYALRELNCPCPQCAVAQFMSEGQFMSFSSITPFRHKCASRPWCYALRLPTANRRGAICGIRPDKRASRCECSWLSRRRQFIASIARIQHIFYEDPIPFCRCGPRATRKRMVVFHKPVLPDN